MQHLLTFFLALRFSIYCLLLAVTTAYAFALLVFASLVFAAEGSYCFQRQQIELRYAALITEGRSRSVFNYTHICFFSKKLDIKNNRRFSTWMSALDYWKLFMERIAVMRTYILGVQS